MNKRLITLVMILLAAAMVTACNLPIGQQPPAETPVIGDMELTLTAASQSGLYATATQMAVRILTLSAPPTATPLPSATLPPTATLLPSSTPLPPATATPVISTAATGPTLGAPWRTGPRVSAAYLYKAPVIDGNWGEWIGLTKEFAADAVVFGKDNWSGKTDLGAAFIVGWDNDNLYLGAKVADDKYVQNSSGQYLYRGDSLEILVDTDLDGDYYVEKLDLDDYQLGISPGSPTVKSGREAYLWYPAGLAGSRDEVEIAATAEDGLYRVEARIPWEVLNINPYDGLRLGFVFSVSDNDNSELILQQSMVSNDAYRKLTDPTTWGELVLGK